MDADEPAAPEQDAPPPKRGPGRLERLLGPAFSPHGLLTRAALISAAFAIAHLAGLRAYTTIISGTSPTGDPKAYWAAALGVVYILLYLAFFLLVPVLLLAAGLLLAAFRLARKPDATS